MPSKIQVLYTPFNRHKLLCVGDSLTGAYYNGMRQDQLWPEVLAAKIRALGAHVQSPNFGVGGNKSMDILGRQAIATSNPAHGVPEMIALMIGVNDPMLNGPTLAQGAAGNVNLGAHDYYVTYSGTYSGVVGESPPVIHKSFTVTTAAAQVNLTAIPLGPTGTTSRKIYRSVAGDTGNAASMKLLATIADNTTTTYTDNTADASLGAVQSTPYLTQSVVETILDDWFAAGTARFLVINTPYLNFAGGGDTHTTPYFPFVGVRAALSAAVTSRAAAHPTGFFTLCDLWTYMDNIIQNSPAGNNQVTFGGVTYTIAQGDAAWHIGASDEHLNALGNEIAARAASASFQAQTGALTLFKTP